MSNTKSLGEQRVRIDFNVADSGIVDEIKKYAADFINLVHQACFKYYPEREDLTEGEATRLLELALSSIETGTMYAVKMATI